MGIGDCSRGSLPHGGIYLYLFISIITISIFYLLMYILYFIDFILILIVKRTAMFYKYNVALYKCNNNNNK